MSWQKDGIRVGLSLMLEDDFREAAEPLLNNNCVDVLEWSFDTCWNWEMMPLWAQEIVEHYSRQARLLGHGVHFSALSVFSPLHKEWLTKLSEELGARQYLHISEHFGFSQAGHILRGAPFPIPYCPEAVSLGKENLCRLSETVKLPIGLENLALAFCKKDVIEQGVFLEELVQEIDGFILLDLHNIYCQMHNFSISPHALLQTYPLARVRELHISGGSWTNFANGTAIRRDTHDGDVPEVVFSLLETILGLCPNVSYIILERLGGTLKSASDIANFQNDFARIKKIVEKV